MRILVADDDSSTRRALESLLEASGHSTATAADGVEALELLDEAEFDLAVVDLVMPRLGGLEVARRVSAGETASRPTLVALSACSRPRDRCATREAGFAVHLEKPLDIERLRRLLQSLDAS